MSNPSDTGSKNIPSSTYGKVSEPVRHWWIPERTRSLSESSDGPSSPTNRSSFSFPNTPFGSYSSSPPETRGAFPGDDNKFRDFFRRSSIKNMVYLDDFATDWKTTACGFNQRSYCKRCKLSCLIDKRALIGLNCKVRSCFEVLKGLWGHRDRWIGPRTKAFVASLKFASEALPVCRFWRSLASRVEEVSDIRRASVSGLQA